MSDKFEEAARAFELWLYDNDRLRWRGWNAAAFQWVSDAFRWYDEQREKDHKDDLTCAYLKGFEAGKDKRAAEMCVCTADEVKGKGYSHCHYCGRRIKEVRDEQK